MRSRPTVKPLHLTEHTATAWWPKYWPEAKRKVWRTQLARADPRFELCACHCQPRAQFTGVSVAINTVASGAGEQDDEHTGQIKKR